MGEADGPIDLIPEAEYEKHKIKFVKTQYGVHDKNSGVVTICRDRRHAHDTVAAEPDRWIPVYRSVSDWLEDGRAYPPEDSGHPHAAVNKMYAEAKTG